MTMVPGMYYPQQVVQQPMQVTQRQINVQTAMSYVGQALNQLVAQMQITQVEAQQIVQVLQNNPIQNQALQQKIIQTYGDVSVSQDTLYTFMLTKLLEAAQAIRRNSMPQMQAPIVQPGGFMQPAGYVQPQYNAAPSADNLTQDLYGNRGTAPNVMQPQMTPAANQAPQGTFVQQPVAQAPAPAKQHTNKPFVLPGEPLEEVVRPQWFEDQSVTAPVIKAGEPVPEAVRHKRYNLIRVGDDDTIPLEFYRIFNPEICAEDAIDTVDRIKENDEIQSDLNVISYDEIVPVKANYENSVKVITEARKIYQNESTVAGVLQTCEYLRQQGTIGNQLEALLMEKFNQAASVNFVRFNANTGGIERLSPIKDFALLSRLVTDCDDDTYASWKDPEEMFVKALQTCLTASFGRVFSKVSCGYVNIAKTELRDQVLLRYYKQMGILGSASTIMSPNKTEAQIKDIESKLAKWTFLRVERKIFVHNLKMPEIPANNFNLFPLPDGLSKCILSDFVKYVGGMDTIYKHDTSQYAHPLRLGTLYGGYTVVRRI